MHDCRRVDGERVTARHLARCETPGCEGCEPCAARHCGCGRHLRDDETWTCSRCVGRVRKDLERLDDLCALAPVAAAEMGASHELAVLAGPVPAHSTAIARRRWALGGGLCVCLACPDLEPMPIGPVCGRAAGHGHEACACSHHVCQRRTYRPTCPGLTSWLEYADDDRHPLWVLGSWDILVSEHLEHHARTGRVTVAAAAGYLAANLTDLARDPEFGWDDLAREVRDCRAHVERLMLVADYEQLGAPCPACGAARLRKDYGPAETEDRWTCRRCRQWWTEGDYRAKVSGTYVAVASALTASQISGEYRIPEGSVRGWATKGDVRKRGRDGNGRQLYDVEDVLACRDRKRAG